MKRRNFLTVAGVAFASTAFAQNIPKGLIDSKPDKSILVHLDQYYANRTLPDKPGLDAETIFSSPRSQVKLSTVIKGAVVKPHYHANSDEIIYFVKGSGEMLINGEWVPVKKGDIHINPRGNVHALRAPKENIQVIMIYTPQLPPEGDVNIVSE